MPDQCILVREMLFRRHAAKRCNIKEEAVHIGHLALQAMLDEPEAICQIDAATDRSETNESVAKRSSRLASAMAKYGLKPGDRVILMGINHLDLCIPYFACLYNGNPMCAIDPSIGPNDLIKVFSFVHPKMIFCQKSCEEKVKNALKSNNLQGEIVLFDEPEVDLEAFIEKHNGDDTNYRPAVFDQADTIAWLMLTSGTTGLPKVAVIPFKTLLNAVLSWWEPYPEKLESCLAMATLQWVSSLVYFISGVIKGYTRIQSSEPLTPAKLILNINKYRPNTTAFTPYLLGQFLEGAENVCDLTCFKTIVIGGSAIEKPLVDRLRKKSNAFLYLVYGMTELLAPIFDFDDHTPFGAVGKPLSKYEFRIMADNGLPLEGINETGELWIRGNAFFKGYLNNPEETKTMLTDDGWVKTGDMFYKDEHNYYYFVERKRLLIKHYGFLISPLQMEDIIKQHPGVVEACVVGVPDPQYMELPVAAIVRRNGEQVNTDEIADLLKKNMVGKKLNGGIFFVDSFPVTPSGKIHRAKVKDIALTAPRIMY